MFAVCFWPHLVESLIVPSNCSGLIYHYTILFAWMFNLVAWIGSMLSHCMRTVACRKGARTFLWDAHRISRQEAKLALDADTSCVRNRKNDRAVTKRENGFQRTRASWLFVKSCDEIRSKQPFTIAFLAAPIPPLSPIHRFEILHFCCFSRTTFVLFKEIDPWFIRLATLQRVISIRIQVRNISESISLLDLWLRHWNRFHSRCLIV